MEVIQVNEQELKEKLKVGKVLVDCFATWCGPCKMIAPIIEEIAKEKEDYAFYKLDIDESLEFAEANQIFSIPTLLIYENGELKERVVGFKTKDEILKVLK